MIYNMNFLKKNLDRIRHIYPLDVTTTFNKDYIKLIPKEVILRQYVNKKSETSQNSNTSQYNLCYKETEEYLRNYPSMYLIRNFSLLRRQ